MSADPGASTGRVAPTASDAPVAPPRTLVGLHPTLALLLGGGGAVLLISGLRAIAGTVAPTFLAVTLVIAVYPLYERMKARLPGWLAATGLLVTLFGIIVIIIASIGIAVQQLVVVLPQYGDRFQGLVGQGQELLRRLHVSDAQVSKVIGGLDLNNFVGVAKQIAESLGSISTILMFLLVASIILVMDIGGLDKRIDHLRLVRPSIAVSLGQFAHRCRRYWVVSTIFGVIVAVCDSVALSIIGVPMALTWGALAFVTNYVPNIGFIVGLVPPALLALLDGGIPQGVAVVVAYSVLNVLIQTILQPKFTGDAVGLNVTTTFLSLAFWSYVFGALGAILAIPLTLLVKALFIDRDADTRWLNVLVANHLDRATLESIPPPSMVVGEIAAADPAQVSTDILSDGGQAIPTPASPPDGAPAKMQAAPPAEVSPAAAQGPGTRIGGAEQDDN